MENTIIIPYWQQVSLFSKRPRYNYVVDIDGQKLTIATVKMIKNGKWEYQLNPVSEELLSLDVWPIKYMEREIGWTLEKTKNFIEKTLLTPKTD